MGRTDRPPFVQKTREQFPDKDIEIWFQDEARFGQKGSLTKVWAPKGSRPEATRQTEYGYTYIFGAACPATGASVALVLPHANTTMMNLFMSELSGRIAAGTQCVLVLDNAGWHRSHELAVPANISLLFLPPYTPEENPMERVWHHLKRRHLSNRVLADDDAVVSACAEAWNRIDADRIRSLCGRQDYLVR